MNGLVDLDGLAAEIVRGFDAMPAQIRAAARYVLENPRDVALLSMREQARRAGVQPATMMRLARQLGFDGYEALRELHADTLREAPTGFAGKAGDHLTRQERGGDEDLASAMLGMLGAQLGGLAAARPLAAFAGAAQALASARRIHCLGLRASHPVAWHLHYALTLIGRPSVLLDGIAAIGADALVDAAPGEVMVAVSLQPYTRLTLELAEHAASRGLSILAITDSEVAPLARISRHHLVVPTASPSFLHAVTPAFAAAEVLAALVAGHDGEKALAALRRADAHLAALGTHLTRRPQPKLPGTSP